MLGATIIRLVFPPIQRGRIMDERIQLLRNTPIFGGVAEEILALLLDRVEEVAVRKGEFFFLEGDDGKSAFVLERGSVSILKQWEEKSYLLRHLHAGDCFGEVALMDFCRRSASVLADEDCTAIELSTSDLRLLVAKPVDTCNHRLLSH